MSESNISSPMLLFLRMLFFSISTATLCGTSVIEPIEWYTDIIVGLQVDFDLFSPLCQSLSLSLSAQMLTSFVYFTSIMSVALTPRRRSQFDLPSSNRGRSKSPPLLCLYSPCLIPCLFLFTLFVAGFTKKIRRFVFGERDSHQSFTL